MNYDFGILPHRKRLRTVIGRPIPIPKVTHPTIDEVKYYHGLYIQGLQELYQQFRGPDDPAELIID